MTLQAFHDMDLLYSFHLGPPTQLAIATMYQASGFDAYIHIDPSFLSEFFQCLES